MHFPIPISFAIALSIQCLPIASAVQVFAGAKKLGRPADTCDDIQEFSCIGDRCDPFAGPDHNGRCRNGDKPSVFCPASELCDQPTKGHCLDNTISASGVHGMPSNKHFYCVNVIDFDKPVVLWENSDCTGKSCYIQGNGHWQAWASSVQANCIEIAPVTPINTRVCLAPGQDGFFAPQGGFPSDLAVSVGGVFGLPAAYENTHTCDKLPDFTLPSNDFNGTTQTGDLSQSYSSGLDISLSDPGVDTDDLGRRSTFMLEERGLIKTSVIRSGKCICSIGPFKYTAAYIAGQQIWFYGNELGQLLTDNRQVSDRVPDGFSVEHIIELALVVNFISQNRDQLQGAAARLTANQWKLLQDLLTAGGRKGGRTSGVCDAFFQLASVIGSGSNVIGLSERLNNLKGTLFSRLLQGQGPPDFGAGWARPEAQALLDFMLRVGLKAQSAAFGIGAFLDNIAGTAGDHSVSQGFESYAMSNWYNAVQTLQNALSQPRGFFKTEPNP